MLRNARACPTSWHDRLRGPSHESIRTCRARRCRNCGSDAARMGGAGDCGPVDQRRGEQTHRGSGPRCRRLRPDHCRTARAGCARLLPGGPRAVPQPDGKLQPCTEADGVRHAVLASELRSRAGRPAHGGTDAQSQPEPRAVLRSLFQSRGQPQLCADHGPDPGADRSADPGADPRSHVRLQCRCQPVGRSECGCCVPFASHDRVGVDCRSVRWVHASARTGPRVDTRSDCWGRHRTDQTARDPRRADRGGAPHLPGERSHDSALADPRHHHSRGPARSAG